MKALFIYLETVPDLRIKTSPKNKFESKKKRIKMLLGTDGGRAG